VGLIPPLSGEWTERLLIGPPGNAASSYLLLYLSAASSARRFPEGVDGEEHRDGRGVGIGPPLGGASPGPSLRTARSRRPRRSSRDRRFRTPGVPPRAATPRRTRSSALRRACPADFVPPNARGVELVAELIFEKLLTLGWLDPEPGATRWGLATTETAASSPRSTRGSPHGTAPFAPGSPAPHCASPSDRRRCGRAPQRSDRDTCRCRGTRGSSRRRSAGSRPAPVSSGVCHRKLPSSEAAATSSRFRSPAFDRSRPLP
jgi:hypothetical protein